MMFLTQEFWRFIEEAVQDEREHGALDVDIPAIRGMVLRSFLRSVPVAGCA